MSTKRIAVVCMIAAMAAGETCLAQEAKKDDSNFKLGGDIRIREEYLEDIPSRASKQDNYFRFRAGVWSEYTASENALIRVRVTDEVRAWQKPDAAGWPQAQTYEFPDQIVVDNLYLDLHKLMNDRLDVRIGRQDMKYGTGKLIMDGTPGDGSRTAFFDAIRLSWRGVPETVVDVFGIYNSARPDLVWDPKDAKRDFNGYRTAVATDDTDDSAAGIYVMNKSLPDTDLEVYDIFKREDSYHEKAATNSPAPGSRYNSPKYAWQTLDETAGLIENPALELNTTGFRVAPKFGKKAEMNFEAAIQTGKRGDEDVLAYMVDASATWFVPFRSETLQPAASLIYYRLSGDDPATDKDEGWNPLFARWPQYSELLWYDSVRGDQILKWSNVEFYLAQLCFKPHKRVKSTLSAGYVMAPEDDGPGSGRDRGTLFKLWNEVDLGKGLLTANDTLTAHAGLDVLDPHNYYASSDLAVFARWQVMYTF